jgi:hypothetical protein
VRRYNTYLSIIGFVGGKEGAQRVIRRQNKPSGIYKELAGDVEEDEKEVHARKAEEYVDFRDRCLLLEVVEDFVLRQLLWRQRKAALATRARQSRKHCPGFGFYDKGYDGLSDELD